MFLGFREDVGDLLAACDLVALPSLREGLSIALLEAMAAGKPVIATSIGSHRELAAQSEIAVLVPPADPQALCTAICQLAQDPARMARLGAGGRALFESRYTEERMLTAYQRLYFDLLQMKYPEEAVRAKEPARIAAAPPVQDATPQPRNRTTVVRRAIARDLADIVGIHQRAFSHSFLTLLGGKFLRRYYSLVLDYRAGIVLVSEVNGVIQGFVCGFLDPADFYRFMWRNKRTFVLPVLSAIIRHPSLAARVLQGVQRIHTSASHEPARSCELSSIAVAPDAATSGLGQTLVRAFLAEAWSLEAQCVYLTTDAEGNRPANALYRKTGFQRTQQFLQHRGRWMNAYVIHRVPAEDPCGIHP
jgi:ribosomal protein S18 acetylase RimI-like enzyme